MFSDVTVDLQNIIGHNKYHYIRLKLLKYDSPVMKTCIY